MAGKMGGQRRAKRSKSDILAATVRVLSREPAAAVTVEAVAKETGCAKGLVHYHFKTKDGLFAAAAVQIWVDRSERWKAALATADPKAAIDRSWQLLADESKRGVSKACSSLAVEQGEMTVQAVKKSAAALSVDLAGAVEGLFGRIGLVPTVVPTELGALLSAMLAGFGHQFDASVPTADLESAYAAFWAGLLSFARPVR